jgi:Rab-like protein 2
MESKQEPVLDDLPDPDLKIILLGDSAVGKSKLIERYLMDEYNPRQVR